MFGGAGRLATFGRAQCSDVRMRYFGVASPTSTTIGGLAQPEAMVEIEMIAVVE